MALLATTAPDISLRNLALGFIAAVVSVLIFHQGTILILNVLNLLPSVPWSLRPIGPLSVPVLVNQMFWGGLWGLLFAVIWPQLPGRDFWLKGLVFGLAGPLLIGNWLLVPLIKGGGPLFAGFDPRRMLISALITAAFGIGLGLIYGGLRKRA
ncbi:hypothetical protein [Bosea sp. (in: a-proteobacteria)]|jgi:hypothetical protein|uniref:hypothetical protein n=1 Tax=Bosea sp. (in: a-proteobacteria) TaxID=1871050 RepID=UPI003F727E94